jgi:SAM-dependent methyltransferase
VTTDIVTEVADDKGATATPEVSKPEPRKGGRVIWNRKVMNDETIAWVSKFPTETLDALEISGSVWQRRCKWKSYESHQFPQFDLNYDVVEGKTFDFIFLEQVLEHVKYPYRSVRNVHRMLRPGGWVLSTTPFLVNIHGGANMVDYTRWTPQGLTYLFEEGGFDRSKMITGQWGNRQCACTDFHRRATGKHWIVYDETKHKLVNEPRFPVSCWIMAQKD